MPRLTPNLNLATFDAGDIDRDVTELAFKDALAGYGVNSNMYLIDEAIQNVDDKIENLYIPDSVTSIFANFIGNKTFEGKLERFNGADDTPFIVLTLDQNSTDVTSLKITEEDDDTNTQTFNLMKYIDVLIDPDDGTIERQRVNIEAGDLRENTPYFLRYYNGAYEYVGRVIENELDGILIEIKKKKDIEPIVFDGSESIDALVEENDYISPTSAISMQLSQNIVNPLPTSNTPFRLVVRKVGENQVRQDLFPSNPNINQTYRIGTIGIDGVISWTDWEKVGSGGSEDAPEIYQHTEIPVVGKLTYDAGHSFIPNSNAVWVYVGGVKQYTGDSYTENGDGTITFKEEIPTTDTLIEFTVFSATPTAGLTSRMDGLEKRLFDLEHSGTITLGIKSATLYTKSTNLAGGFNEDGTEVTLTGGATFVETYGGVKSTTIAPATFQFSFNQFFIITMNEDTGTSTIRMSASYPTAENEWVVGYATILRNSEKRVFINGLGTISYNSVADQAYNLAENNAGKIRTLEEKITSLEEAVSTRDDEIDELIAKVGTLEQSVNELTQLVGEANDLLESALGGGD